MKKVNDEQPVTDPGEITVEVTEEEYQEGLKRGWTDDDMLKPGRYKARRGGFMKRHPELAEQQRKRA